MWWSLEVFGVIFKGGGLIWESARSGIRNLRVGIRTGAQDMDNSKCIILVMIGRIIIIDALLMRSGLLID